MGRKVLVWIVVIAVVLLIAVGGYLIWFYTLGGSYWNGGKYAGQPVYSTTQGISKPAHNKFAACGLPDTDISGILKFLDSIEYMINHSNSSGGQPDLTSPITYSHVDSSGHEVPIASYTVDRLEPGVYLVTSCRKLG